MLPIWPILANNHLNSKAKGKKYYPLKVSCMELNTVKKLFKRHAHERSLTKRLSVEWKLATKKFAIKDLPAENAARLLKMFAVMKDATEKNALNKAAVANAEQFPVISFAIELPMEKIDAKKFHQEKCVKTSRDEESAAPYHTMNTFVKNVLANPVNGYLHKLNADNSQELNGYAV